MERLNGVLASYVADGDKTKDKLLGAAVAITTASGQTYSTSAGRNALPANSPAYTPSTFQFIASMTKLVCAVACMQLVERGDLTLDTDMREHVPELSKLQILRGFDTDGKPIFEANNRPMTLRQLLTHSSGVTYDLADPRVLRYNETRNKSHSTILRTTKDSLFDLPLTFAPGESWAYGPGIEYAGLAVERIMDQSLGEYMGEHIFAPLGMNATTFHPLRLKEDMERQGRWAVDIPQRNEAGTLINWPGPEERAIPLEPEYESGGSGLYSCAEDYIKLISALLRGGRPILKPETVEVLLKPTLGDASRETLQKGMWTNPSGEYVKEMEFDHAPGGLVILRDNGDGVGRRAGTVRWSGMNHAIWFIDRVSGIAVTLFTSVLHPTPVVRDAVVTRMFMELEKAIYGEVLPEIRKAKANGAGS